MPSFFNRLAQRRDAQRCYVVCAIPRSGSNLLTDGLHATRRAGRPKQFFLQTFEARYGAKHGLDPAADYAAYVRGIVTAARTANAVFGFKLMSWYLGTFLGRLRVTGEFGTDASSDLELLEAAFPRLRFVHIVRQNKLRQAISKARAEQTELWKIGPGKNAVRDPQFDSNLISRCLRDGEEQEAIWDGFFRDAAIEPFTVTYEELCQNYEGILRQVLNFLGIRLPRNVMIGEPRTIRQSDAISDEWERRYKMLAVSPQDIKTGLAHV